MRIERIRQLIWGVDILIAVAAVLCLWVLLLDPSSKPGYDRPEDWKRRPRASKPVGRNTLQWVEFDRVRAFAMNGEKPVILDPVEESGEAVLEKSAVARLATLRSYTRFIPPTDEAQITVVVVGRTDDPVVIGIGQKIPGSVWILVDVREGEAEFQSEQDPNKKGVLELAAAETSVGGGKMTAGAGGTAEGGAPGRVDPGGALTPGTTRQDLDAVEVGPGRWQMGKGEMGWLSDDGNIESIRSSFTARPWKNPETGNYEGLSIRKLKKTSYVAKRGGRSGDILISINGVRVIGREDVINYVRNRGKNEKQYTLKILRNGREMDLVYNRPK